MSLGGRGKDPPASYRNQSGQPLYALLMTTQRYLKTHGWRAVHSIVHIQVNFNKQDLNSGKCTFYIAN